MTEINVPPPKNDGRFPKGHVPAVRHARGTRNKITRDIKEGLIKSAVKHGFDGEGKDGLVGYFNYLLKNDLRAHANLIGRLIPLDLTANLQHHQRLTVKVVSVPRGTFFTKEQAEQIMDMNVDAMPVIEAAVNDKEAAVSDAQFVDRIG